MHEGYAGVVRVWPMAQRGAADRGAGADRPDQRRETVTRRWPIITLAMSIIGGRTGRGGGQADRGAIALSKLKNLAQPANLSGVIERLNFGSTGAYDPRSCAINNTAIIKTLTNQEIPQTWLAAQLLGGKELGVDPGQKGEHTAAVMKALRGPVIVSFGLKFTEGDKGRGDHYFSAFPLDDQTIIVGMGWQGAYDLGDYFRHNDAGRFERAKFEVLMRQIEDGEIEGVYGLCSFLGETTEGISIPSKLMEELEGTRPEFQKKTTSYFALPDR